MDFPYNRPNPDDLLASMKEDDEKSKRVKLKIFFGMYAGVGKPTPCYRLHKSKSF